MAKQTKHIEGGSPYYKSSSGKKFFENSYILDMLNPTYQIGNTLPGGIYKDAIRTKEQVKEFERKQQQNRVDMLRLEGIHFKLWEDRNRANNGTKLNSPMIAVPHNAGPEFYDEVHKLHEYHKKVDKQIAVISKLDKHDKQTFKAWPGH